MNVNKAIELLELKLPYSDEELKKNYYRKCLQYHPDKNSDGVEIFKKIQEAYELLQKEETKKTINNKQEREKDISYMNILNCYINKFANKYGWSDEFIRDSLSKLLNNAQEVSLRFFEEMDDTKALELYEYVSKYNQLFNIGSTLLENMKTILEKKVEKNKVIILNPSIEDLINDNIYVLELNDEKYYVPLWHNELYYNNNLVVSIIPKLEENMYIDDDNNLHILVSKKLNELFDDDKLIINIGGKLINIEVNSLYIKEYQIKVIENEGLSIINEKEIFKNNKRGNIIVHLSIIK